VNDSLERCENKFLEFADRIRELPDKVSASDVFTDSFCLFRGAVGRGRRLMVEVYYAPFDYHNRQAKVIIVGLTPGENQVVTAFAAAKQALSGGVALEEVIRRAKGSAAFRGLMRKKLVGWLDGLALNQALEIRSCEQLFAERSDLLHATSAFGYPVLVARKNYGGWNPRIHDLPDEVYEASCKLPTELRDSESALVIPLGSAVEAVLHRLGVGPKWCLWHFPHPSGSFAQGPEQYQTWKSVMEDVVKRWRQVSS
jgi:hypothetical protein